MGLQRMMSSLQRNLKGQNIAGNNQRVCGFFFFSLYLFIITNSGKHQYLSQIMHEFIHEDKRGCLIINCPPPDVIKRWQFLFGKSIETSRIFFLGGGGEERD